MIGDLRPYAVRKDSGVEWLGEVPEHWEVRRNGRLFAQRNETGYPDLPILEVSLRTGVRVRDFANSTRKQVMSERDKYKRAAKGDIAYNMMRMWQGAVGVVPEHGLISPAYVVARPLSGSNTSYFERLFRTPAYMQEVDNYSRGIVKDRNRLYWEDFKRIPTCYPPPEEQATIVRYLDHVDQRVRRLVWAKRKLIALLTEQKQAITHRAVTRGLDPNAPLMDSSVAWLGEVPVHWEVRKLRQCGSIAGGMTPSMEVRRYWNGDIPWITPKDMKTMAISDSSVRVTKSAVEETSLRMIDARAVLLVVRGMILARKVPIAWTMNPVTINQDMKAIRTSQGVDSRYLAMMLDSAQDAFIPLIDEAGHGTKRLPTERWRNLAVGVPPLSEQTTIVDYVDRATADIDTAITSATREIDLLTEYRTRLTADVVTGKLDVREAAAALPEFDPLAADDEPDGPDAESEADFDDPGAIQEEAEA